MPCFGTTSRTKNNAFRSHGRTWSDKSKLSIIAEVVRMQFKNIDQDEKCT